MLIKKISISTMIASLLVSTSFAADQSTGAKTNLLPPVSQPSVTKSIGNSNYPDSSNNNPNQATTNITKPAQTASKNDKPVILNQGVAIVNNHVITSNELNEAVSQTKAQLQDQGISLPDDLTLERQVLQQLINQEIILELAKRNNIIITDNDINQTIQTIADANHITAEQLKQKLSQSGISYEQYRQTMKKQLMIQRMQQKLVAGSIFIPPKEITAYVEKHLSQSKTEQYEVSNILLPLPDSKTPDAISKAKQMADKLITEIKSSKISFSDAAKKYSQSGNALSGGSLGFKTLDQLPTLFANKVETMKKGEIIGPFEANGALQILKLDNIKSDENQKHWIEEYHVEQIMLKLTPILNSEQAKAQLDRILIALKNGESFSEQAKANTQNYDAASKGGDLGWVNLEQSQPELAQVIQKTPVNQLSQPFQVGDTWQIIKVLGKKKVDNTEDYLRMQAANILFRQRAEQMVKNWQMSVRGQAYVKILNPKLEMPGLDDE